MTWSNLSWATGNILTSSQMTSMQANFQAIASADTGAPSLINAALGDGSIAGDKVSRTSVAESSFTIAALATVTPTTIGWNESTFYANSANQPEPKLQVFVSSAWRTSGQTLIGFCIFDGTNVRLYNSNSTYTVTVQYRKFSS